MMHNLDKRIDEWAKDDLEKQRGHPSDRLGRFEDLKFLFEEANGYPHGDEYTVFIGASLDNLCRLGILRHPAMGRPSYRLETFGAVFLESCMKFTPP
jgi:hypothetical protein